MLVSSSRVKKDHRAIEKEMMRKVNIEVINDKFNNKVSVGVHFDVKQLFRYLVTHSGLAAKAKRGTVEFAITCDGALLDDLTGHLTISFKIVDKDDVCPIIWKNIFHDLGNMQADKWCFPILMIIAKEDKDSYDKYLLDFFNFVKKLLKNDLVIGSHSK
jgi:hypothetical protein